MLPDTVDVIKDIILSVVALLSIGVSITAIFVGNKRSLKISEMQIEASTKLANKQLISPMRQIWIGNLRSRMSEYLSLSEQFYRFMHDTKGVKEFQKDNNMEIIPKDAEMKLDSLYLEIHLMLNDKEHDHLLLNVTMDKLRRHIFDKDLTSEKFYTTYRSITDLCKSILKREWEVVKNDEQTPSR